MMDKNKILKRLKAIKGQLQLVITMTENNRDYFSLMQQSMAVKGGLKKLNCHILQYHLKKHAFKGFNPEEQRNDFEHLMKVIKKYQSCKS